MNSGIYKFNEVDINLNSIGGKAKNLAILTQNNFPVPDGFIVSLEAFNDNKLTKEAIATIIKLTDKKILVQRKKNNREECIIPGGKRIFGESDFETLKRESKLVV